MPQAHQFVLTLACPDAKGIVHAVSGLLYQAGCNIIDSQQFGDLEGDDATGLFFMRVHFQAPPQLADAATLSTLFEHTRQQFGMQVHFHALAARPRVLLMVSQHGHCLNDLLFRWKSGSLPVDIPAIVSNHRTYEALAASYGIPFHHLPLAGGSSAETKRAQEQQVEALIAAEKIDLVVLARYMQILSAEFCQRAGRPRHQHPPQLPAQLQGRAALLPGACARRQADRRHRALRDRRPGRRPHHRTGRAARGPHAVGRGLHRRGPRHRMHGAGPRRALAGGTPRADQRPQVRGLPLDRPWRAAPPLLPLPAAATGSPDELEAEFYEALQQGDIERLMAVWADDDEIVCVHPGGGRVIGAAAIRASFEAIFAAGGGIRCPSRCTACSNWAVRCTTWWSVSKCPAHKARSRPGC
jgi:formyltetrahydrofolate deformylase